jgi:hypothetical protein
MLVMVLHARHVLDDPSAYTTSATLWSLENLLSASVDSGTREGLAHHGRYIHVGLLALKTPECDPNQPPLPIGSWEFVTSLGFEWSVIRGHRPYRWTIWVRMIALTLDFLRVLV